jgi:hypothetical protein
MKRPENDKWLDEVLSETIGSKKPRTDFEEWKQNHPEAVEMLTSRAKSEIPTIQHPQKIRNIIMKSPITKLAAAAVIVIAVFICIEMFDTNGSSVVWADVAERFESVPFFNLTLYLGHETSTQAKKVEIWKSDDFRIRAHEENKVIFADFSNGKKNIIAYDRTSKQLVHGMGFVAMILENLCADGRFSLKTIINSIPSEDDIIKVETPDTAASKETVVFKIKHKTTPEWISIWALRTSKLPVRICFHDPRNNELGDFLFNYSEKKDNNFFDPETFKNQK